MKIEDFLMEQTEYSERRLRSLLKPFLDFLDDKGVSVNEFDQKDVIEYIDKEEYKKYAERIKNGNKEELKKETLLQVYYGLVDLIRYQRDDASNRQTRFEHTQRLAQVEKLKKKRLKYLSRKPQKTSEKRKWLNTRELDYLLNHTYDSREKTSKKDFHRFYLLGYFGTRVGELFEGKNESNIVDIDWDKGRLVVMSEKSYYERVLYFDEITKKIFERSIEREWLGLFPYWRMEEYKRLFPDLDITPHYFRYTFNHHIKNVINQLVLDREIREDADLLLKSLMGHTTGQDMSKYYDSTTEESIRKVMLDNHFYRDLQINQVLQSELGLD